MVQSISTSTSTSTSSTSTSTSTSNSIRTFIISSFVWILICILIINITTFTSIQQSIYNTISGKSFQQKQLLNYKLHRSQPYWTYKFDFMEQPYNVQEQNRICFVHIGKTAGSTIACYLGFNYGQCRNGINETASITYDDSERYNYTENDISILQQMIPPGNLPHYTTSMIHREYDSCHENNQINSMYLYIVRNPFTRIQSWFEYERPLQNERNTTESYIRKRPLFIDCNYTTLDILGGSTGLGTNELSTLCSRRAYRAITGETGYMNHNKYNYKYYYDIVQKHILLQQQKRNGNNNNNNNNNTPRILILRTEHLEYDWLNIENNILTNNDNNKQQLPLEINNLKFTHKNKSPKKKEDLYISNISKNNICIVLCYEIQIYKLLLSQAINLNIVDYSTSLHELAKDCPNETIHDKCTTFWPSW